MSGPAQVQVRGVRRDYPGGVTALTGVDLDIFPGELVAVVGPSGSGKSTLLQLIGTLDRPTAGSVVIAGYDVARLNDRQVSALRARLIGFVFQQFHLAPGQTVLDNVADGLLYSGTPIRASRQLAAETMSDVGLANRLHHLPSQLSGGERQRVAIARAMVSRPALLLADEPTGSLDTASGAVVMALLSRLNASGTTVVVITHDREIAAGLPRQLHIRDGQVVEDSGRPADSPGRPAIVGSPDRTASP